jgi:hypothetical protein
MPNDAFEVDKCQVSLSRCILFNLRTEQLIKFQTSYKNLTYNGEPTDEPTSTNPIIVISNLCRKITQPSEYGIPFCGTKR